MSGPIQQVSLPKIDRLVNVNPWDSESWVGAR